MAQLIHQRYQFIQTLGAKNNGQVTLVGDTQQAGHPSYVLRQMHLPLKNPRQREFCLLLLHKQAQKLAQLSYDASVAHLRDHFVDGDYFYLVEEYIPGYSLEQKLSAGKRYSAKQAWQLVQELLKILEFVHSHDVIHRNIKPDRIIYRQTDHRIVLVGFGFFREIIYQTARQQALTALPLDPSVTAYMAPEQVAGKSQPNTDLYSVGLIAIQALTGLDAATIAQSLTPEMPAVPAWATKLALTPSAIAFLKKLAQPSLAQRYRSATAALQSMSPAGLLGSSLPPSSPPAAQLAPPLDPPPNGQSPPVRVKGKPLPPPPKPASSLVPVTPARPLPAKATAAAPTAPVSTESLAPTIAASPARTEPKPPRRQPPRVIWGLGVLGLTVLVILLVGQVPQRLVALYWLTRGAQHQAAADWDGALTAYDRVLDWRPGQPQAYFHRGQVYQSLGDNQAALDDLTTAIATENAHTAQAYYQRGNIRFAVGDYEGALADYTATLEREPTHAKAHVNRGTVYAALGKEPHALADYNQAVALAPDFAPAYLNRCLSRSNLGDQEGAIADCNQAINLRPTHPLAYQNRGLARRRLGDFQGAIADYNVAIELDAQDADPFYNRGLARQDLGDFQGAIADFTAAMVLDPEHVLVYYDRGLAYRATGQLELARRDLQAAAQHCLELGRVRCYEDARYALTTLDRAPEPAE